jgi:hypothetical protein
MNGGDPDYALTFEQAQAMLPEGDEIHTLLDGGLALIGADWERANVLALLRIGRPERSGPQAEEAGHGLVAFLPGGEPLFIATRGGAQ